MSVSVSSPGTLSSNFGPQNWRVRAMWTWLTLNPLYRLLINSHYHRNGLWGKLGEMNLSLAFSALWHSGKEHGLQIGPDFHPSCTSNWGTLNTYSNPLNLDFHRVSRITTPTLQFLCLIRYQTWNNTSIWKVHSGRSFFPLISAPTPCSPL